MIHPITTITNMSMQDIVVPDDFKQVASGFGKSFYKKQSYKKWTK